ncbi:restriction endonuclease subunit S [Pseudomonas sihuiensis]
MAAIVPEPLIVSRYLFWWLSSNYQNIRNMAGGDLRDGLNLELIGNIPALLPAEAEQTQIARFLDHETARIDALIEEQQRLIELLKEKRQAVISHAVTKGLDPTVPMKDSGVEWLGKVPAHWVVSRLKNVVSFITSGPRGWSDYIDESGEDIFLQSGDMDNRLNVLFDKAKRITTPEGAEGVRTRVCEGDVFVCITGANTGRVAVVKDMPGVSYVNQHLGLLRPQVLSCDSRYLGYALSSTSCQTYFSVEQYGLKEGLSLTDLAEAPLMVPTIAEQVALVKSVEEQLINLDKLSVDAERTVELLTERRAALISAAVTGKIDVRGWRPPARAQATKLEVAEAV